MRGFKALTAAALLAVSFGVTACNTVEGAGQDVRATGRAIENTADAAKPNAPN